MTDKAPIILTLETWFRDPKADAWDCDWQYLVIVGDQILERTHGSGATYWRDKLREEFPTATWHDKDLSLHRGLIEPHGLQGLDDETLAVLRTRFKFKD